MHRIYLSTILITCFVVVPHFAFGACDRNASDTTTFKTQLAAATPGQTLCLATGSYGDFDSTVFTGITKTSPGVTITAAAGATPKMRIRLMQGSTVAAWLIFDSIRFTGGTGDLFSPAHDITFRNSTFADKLSIWSSGTNIVFDNDLFNMADNPTGVGGGEGRLQFWGSGNITVKNSKFTSGCADGIQFSGGGGGVTIGPNNEFFSIRPPNGCGAHVDAMQFVNTPSPGPTITGNYFHDNDTGVVAYDGPDFAVITNNVMANMNQDPINVGGMGTGASIVEHNTVIGGHIVCNGDHQGANCGATIRNNVTGAPVQLNCPGCSVNVYGVPAVNDYNLCTFGTCVGSHSLNGAATYVGGTNPTSYVGFALTSASLGNNAATDGTDIGINATSTGSTGSSGPTPPTGLAATVQ